MENSKLITILVEVEEGIKTPFKAYNEILTLYGVSKHFNRLSFVVGVGCGMAIGLSVALIILNVF